MTKRKRLSKKLLLIMVISNIMLRFYSCIPQIKLDPESQKFYEYARLIMTSEENKIFLQLRDEQARKEFIEEFWAKRDPDPETEENEFKNEFYRRIDYANKHFNEGIPGWKTDRGRIYIYMGPPDKFEEFFSHNDPEIRGSILWWIYYDYELVIEFVDRRGMNHYEIRTYSGDFFGAMEKIKLGQIGLKEKGLKIRQADFDLTYDERSQEAVVSLPLKSFKFLIEGEEMVSRLGFEFYLYRTDGEKVQRFKEKRLLKLKEADLTKMQTAEFRFLCPLGAGNYYFDCLILSEDETFPRTRKIFEITVKK
ncbi:MAG: GWxTD domain-containing protein [Candidatus Aminicenantes bacterium]|nr:GWxTD domain-containing protein [Candidatus Aminicenantes bacterium]